MAQEVSLNGRVTNFEADQLRGLASVGGSGGWEREEEKQVCMWGGCDGWTEFSTAVITPQE